MTAHPLFDQLPEPVVGLDPTFAVLYTNVAFASLLGATRGALLGSSSWLAELEARAPGLTAALEHVSRSGTPTTVDLDARQTLTVYRAGGAVWVVGRSAAALGLGSEPRIPVSESRRGGPEKAEALLSVLAHDLRTPLSAISLAATMLELSGEDARNLGLAARILGSARRMRRMVDQLLDLTALRAPCGLLLERRPTSLSAIAEKAITELETAHGSLDARVEAQGDVHGEWDEDRLAQLLANLLCNAVQHGLPGPIVVRVDGRDEGTVVVEIENPGSIPAHQVPEVFEPFSRAGRRVSRDGLGLGLYIAQRLAHAHGGVIELRSTSMPLTGPTTTFVLTLPRVALDTAPLSFDALQR